MFTHHFFGLKRVLGLVLKLGNKLNSLAGTEDKARGFSLSSLAALAATKGFDGKTTMLSYLESLISRKRSELLDFTAELPHVRGAARELSVPTLKADIAALRRGADALDACLARCAGELAAAECAVESAAGATARAAVAALAPARETAALISAGATTLAERCAAAEAEFAALLRYLAQDAALDPSALFETIAAFGAEFDATHAKNDQLRARRERLKAQAATREQRRARKQRAPRRGGGAAAAPADEAGGEVAGGEVVAGVRDRKGALLAIGDRVKVKTKRIAAVAHVKFIGRTAFAKGEFSFMYRYILRESCSQFDSLPLTSLTCLAEKWMRSTGSRCSNSWTRCCALQHAVAAARDAAAVTAAAAAWGAAPPRAVRTRATAASWKKSWSR